MLMCERILGGSLAVLCAKGSDMTRFHRCYTAVCRVWHPWTCSRAGPRAKRFSGESEPPESAVETIGASGEFGRGAHASPLGCARPPGQNPAKGREILGQLAPRLNEPRRRRLVGGANGIRTSSIPYGANRKRIRTAKIGNRDKRGPRRLIGLKLAVSGLDALRPLCQNPAKAREILGLSLVAGAKSLQPETGWRRGWDSNPRYPCEYT